MTLGVRYSSELSAVERVIRAKAAPETADWFCRLLSPAVGFTEQPVDSGSGSCLGGAPRVATRFDWPQYYGEPMLLLAQVDCREIAALLGPEWPGPADGYLLIFHDDDFHAGWGLEDGDDGCRVLHVVDSGGEVPTTRGAHTMPRVPLSAELVVSAPGLLDLEFWPDELNNLHSLLALVDLAAEAVPTPEHQLLGWSARNNMRPVAGHRSLFAVGAVDDIHWGECCEVSFWIRDEDLRAGDFGLVRRSLDG